MKTFKINLKDEYSFLQGGELAGLLMDLPMDGKQDWKRPALIVVPGGGYAYCGKREREPVVAEFWRMGYQVFNLTYLCAPQGVRYPEQLLELSSAVDYVRKHAEAFNVNPDEIFVVGFSAGGHLTANLAVDYQNVSKKAGVELDCKPTAVGLCYPVISQIHGHQGSYENLLKGYSAEEQAVLLKVLNLDELVTKDAPPAFLWSTVEDDAVPADNAIRYALACDRAGVSYELHVYPCGGHGLSTGSLEINGPSPALKRISRWMEDCNLFFQDYIKEEF